MSDHYDVIVIGSGQGGNPLAIEMANAGRKVAVIERKHVGGTCVNVGCTPTKTMVASARVAHLVNRAADYGVQVRGGYTIDMAHVRERKREIVVGSRDGLRNYMIEDVGVDIVMGEGHFLDKNTIEVALNEGGTRELTADIIVINTGGRPRVPALEGLDTLTNVLNSTTIMELEDVPEHLLVLGGGYIGMEFGQMFRRFGSDVTIVQRDDQLVPREDPDVGEAVKSIFEEDGATVLLSSDAKSVREENGAIHLTVDTPDGEQTLTGSHLLIAAGRVPNTSRLNLDATGVETDKRGFVQVNDHLETNVPGIYALGDVKGGPAFTHISYDDYRVLETNLIKGGDASIAGRLVPYTMFIDPQLGRIGMSEKEAEQAGINYRVAKIPMTRVARAREVDETRGFMKAIVDADTDQILGATILGIEGGEIVAVIQVAMMGNLPYTAIRDGTFSHPTLAESLNNLFSTLE